MLPVHYSYSDAGRPPLTRNLISQYDTGMRDSRQYAPTFQREHHDYDYEGGRDSQWARRVAPDVELHHVSQVTPMAMSGQGDQMYRSVDYASFRVDPGRPAPILELAYDPSWSFHRAHSTVFHGARVHPRKAPMTIDPGSAMQDYSGNGELQDMGTRAGLRERGARDAYFMKMDRNELSRPAQGIVGGGEGEQDYMTSPVMWLVERQGIMRPGAESYFASSEWDVELY
jgi:hypothetical protein